MLLILISYLSDRKMTLKFKNILSSLRSLPGSSPQGTVLGVILYIIIFNGAALRPRIPRPIWPLLPKMNNDPVAIKLKFIDDLSIATRINLAKDLVSSADRPQSYTFEERLGTVVSEEANAMQRIVDGLAEFADKRQMVINCEKSGV